MTITDPRYPLCSKLGILRRSSKREQSDLGISTAALYNALGWRTYQKFLPKMRHITVNSVDPASCEAFLRTKVEN